MARPDLEPVGRVERVIQPALNRFYLNAELGLNTVLSRDAAKSTAEAFAALSRAIDLMEAERAAVRQLVGFLGATLLLVAALVLIAWLA